MSDSGAPTHDGQPTDGQPTDGQPADQPSHDAVPELEVDETVPPRPEEEVADAG
ncbi:hypothetical protein GTR02_16880 [Kineococcus sp. R8]|uniref:hypothetical protein n=1 Tax=Kineococcus siccus TaxID=2696567 RepID=UPI0014135C6E|nr:hypothetical protein [Kineococcus siccus]NAZ83493.1 hypothetical protein [Kineococcus siccus]